MRSEGDAPRPECFELLLLAGARGAAATLGVGIGRGAADGEAVLLAWRRGRRGAAGGGGEWREREGHAPVGRVLARAAPLLAHEVAHAERIAARRWRHSVGRRRGVEHGARSVMLVRVLMLMLMRVLVLVRVVLPGRLPHHLVEREPHAASGHGRGRVRRPSRRLLLLLLMLMVVVVLMVRERMRWRRHGGDRRWLRVRLRRRLRLSLRNRGRGRGRGRGRRGGGGGGERRDVLGLHSAQIQPSWSSGWRRYRSCLAVSLSFSSRV